MSDNKKVLGFKIDIEGASNENITLAKITTELLKLTEAKKLLTKSYKEGSITEDQFVKASARLTNELNAQKTKQNELKKVMDSADDSLVRKIALRKKMTDESRNGGEAIEKKLAPAIKKLSDEIKASEEARGVFTRNVGNYPKIMGPAADSMNQLAGAAGGVTSQVSEAATGFLTASGPAGILTAGVALLAAAWKRTKENIDLYLSSADKVKFGFAGYSKDSEESRVDTRRRAEGQISEGVANLRLANYRLTKATTDEEKAQLDVMMKQAYEMIKEGNALKEQVTGQKNRISWTLKYNSLLQEQETFKNKELLVTERVKELSAIIADQRAIATDKDSSSLQIAEASKKVQEAATERQKIQTDLSEAQLVNLKALSEMTATQEVQEDKVSELVGKKAEYQKEYSLAIAKANSYDKKKEISELKEVVELTKEQYDILTIRMAVEKKTADERMKNAISSLPNGGSPFTPFNPDIVADSAKKLKNKVKETVADIGNIIDKAESEQMAMTERMEDAKLQIVEEHAEAKLRVMGGAGNVLQSLHLKNKALQKTELLAEKGLAIAEIVIQTQVANAQIRAKAAASTLPGPFYLARVLANEIAATPLTVANNVAAGLNIAGVVAAAAAGLMGFKGGGKINRGIHVNTGQKDDTLIMANKTETVLTDKHVAMLGGSRTMKNIGVPGFVNGGYVGSQSPYIPPSENSEMIRAIDRRMDRLEIRLDLNKVRSGLNDLDVTTQSQPI